MVKLYVETEDREYGAALAKGLMRRDPIFSPAVGWGEREPEECSLLLTDDGRQGCGVIAILDGAAAAAQGDPQKSMGAAIGRNWDTEQIVKALRDAFYCFYGYYPGAFRSCHAKVMAVTGARGGCGRTSVSFGLAQEFIRYHGQRVLRLSFEEMDSGPEYYAQTIGSAGHYIYYLLREEKRPAADFTAQDLWGVESLVTWNGRNQLTELSPEILSRLLTAVSTEYDRVILDMGGGLSDILLSLLAACDTVVCISGGGRRDMQYLSTLREAGVHPLIVKNRTAAGVEAAAGSPESGLDVGSGVIGRIGSSEAGPGSGGSGFCFSGGLTIGRRGTEARQAEPAETEEGCAVQMEEDPASFFTENGLRRINIDLAFGRGIRELCELC